MISPVKEKLAGVREKLTVLLSTVKGGLEGNEKEGALGRRKYNRRARLREVRPPI
jgi:hypothetical protein